jgi:hypothetical protein
VKNRFQSLPFKWNLQRYSVGLPIRPGTNSDFWVLQGVALLCALND